MKTSLAILSIAWLVWAAWHPVKEQSDPEIDRLANTRRKFEIMKFCKPDMSLKYEKPLPKHLTEECDL